MPSPKKSSDILLAFCGELLADPLDYERRVNLLARVAVGFLCDWAIVSILEADGTIWPRSVAHAEEYKEGLVWGLIGKYPASRELTPDLFRVLDSGRPHVEREVTDTALTTGIEDPGHLARLKSLGMRSMVIAPLTSQGKTFGALTLVRGHGRAFTVADVALAEQLAQLGAHGLANAQLLADERGAREAAEEDLRQLRAQVRAAEARRLGLTQAVNKLAASLRRPGGAQQAALARVLEAAGALEPAKKKGKRARA